MAKVYVATKARGFLESLFSYPTEDLQFIWNRKSVYELNSKIKICISKLIRSEIGSHLGIIQRIKVDKGDFDTVFSYNRFLKTEKKYVIYLENPTALFHYCLGRNETFVGKRKIQGFLNDPNLKAIVCVSKACIGTIRNFYDIPRDIQLKQLYPLIPRNLNSSAATIKEKSHRQNLKCLYISSDFNLKGGREIVCCFKRLYSQGVRNISLRIITRKNSIDRDTLQDIYGLSGVEIHDFKYSYEELQQIYQESNILLNPTRQDSFSLVVLESMKAGNVVLTSDLYAIPEMVKEGYNGFLLSPKHRFFGTDNMPNKNVWNDRKNTIYSNYTDENFVIFLCDKIKYLNENRSELELLALNSFHTSNSGEFNEEYIINEWRELLGAKYE